MSLGLHLNQNAKIARLLPDYIRLNTVLQNRFQLVECQTSECQWTLLVALAQNTGAIAEVVKERFTQIPSLFDGILVSVKIQYWKVALFDIAALHDFQVCGCNSRSFSFHQKIANLFVAVQEKIKLNSSNEVNQNIKFPRNKVAGISTARLIDVGTNALIFKREKAGMLVVPVQFSGEGAHGGRRHCL